MLNDLINDMQTKGLMSVEHFKLRGKSKYLFDMVNIMATTVLVEPDSEFWELRAWMMSMDGGTVKPIGT